jgi:hypothetical protein
MNYCTLLFAVLLSALVSSVGSCQVLNYAESERACQEVVKRHGLKSLKDHVSPLLKDYSETALLEVLRRPDFLLLRLACYHELKSRNLDSSRMALGLLFSATKYTEVYDSEFYLFREESRLQPKATAETFSGSFGHLTNAVPKVIGGLLLIGFSDECINELSDLCLSDKWAVESTVTLIDEIERREGNSSIARATKNKSLLLEQIKRMPGIAQTTVVLYYPFESKDELTSHILAILNDKKLEDVDVVLALLDKHDFVVSIDEDLVATSTDPNLVKKRILELKERSVELSK